MFDECQTMSRASTREFTGTSTAGREDPCVGRPCPASKEDRMSATQDATAVRPFQVGFSDEELSDLRARIKATRWPERETVADASQGVPLALMQDLARYWATEHDWRACEAKLNALPQFLTEIDGLDIHFIHVRSRHDDALPLIVTHG